MPYEGTVGLSVDAPVAILTVDRSTRHNSLVPGLLEKMEEALASVPAGVRAVVLETAGPSFSTGGDVLAFAQRDREDLAEYAERTVGALNRVILALIRDPRPIVVGVQGVVTGGSLGLVLAADLVLASPEASFTPWYREVGFSPDGGWTAILPGVIGAGRASDVLLTNRTITAAEAVAWGLASRLVAGDVRAEARRAAAHVAAGVPGSIRHTKELLRSHIDAVERALDDERRRFIEQVVTDEVRAGMARFLDERTRR